MKNLPTHALERDLQDIFGSDLIVNDRARLSRYSRDQVADADYATAPAAVVFPTRTEQVVRLMKWANITGTAVTPRGAGSGLAGAAIPVPEGIVCSFERMNRIIEIDTMNMMAVVEPGVITNDLDRALEPHGLFFAGYPMSEDICFIGGNVAENAGGGRAVKYGTTGTYVTGARVVSPEGDLLRLGGKRLKDVTGYDLLHLMIGSEGTLGLFTEITIRVVPRPAFRGVIVLAFTASGDAAHAVSQLKRSRALSAVEFLDGTTGLNANTSLPQSRRLAIPGDAGAFLLVEFDGAGIGEIEEGIAAAERIPAATVVTSGTDPALTERVWGWRKAVPWWVKRTAPGYHAVEDVVVPPGEIPALVEHADLLRREYGLPIAVFGHAGDGNFHINPMKPASMPPDEWYDCVERLRLDLYRTVTALGGTISGEHGIGRKRTRYLPLALSPEEIATMRAIKNALDPNGVLNPGVLLPLPAATPPGS